MTIVTFTEWGAMVEVLTSEDLAMRKRAVDEADHSNHMEGLELDETGKADMAEFVSGRIDVEELLARGRRRYGDA